MRDKKCDHKHWYVFKLLFDNKGLSKVYFLAYTNKSAIKKFNKTYRDRYFKPRRIIYKRLGRDRRPVWFKKNKKWKHKRVRGK